MSSHANGRLHKLAPFFTSYGSGARTGLSDPLQVEKSESHYRTGEDFALRTKSAADMHNATSTANDSDLRVDKNWYPFRLNLEAEMAIGIEPDPAPDAE